MWAWISTTADVNIWNYIIKSRMEVTFAHYQTHYIKNALYLITVLFRLVVEMMKKTFKFINQISPSWFTRS